MKKLIALLATSIAVTAQAQLIDDFGDATLLEYTLSRINDGNTTGNVSFSSPSGNLQVAYTGANAFEQVLFLRNDFSLPVGFMLMADVLGTPVGWDRDMGIAVAFSATPPSLAEGASGDLRTGYVEVSVRSNNQVVSFARNGTANLSSGQEFAGTAYGGDTFTAYPTSLFIERLSTTDFQVGWIQGSTKHVLTANGTSFAPYVIATNTPGAAVGFYSDVRVAIAAGPAGLDNLRIVPEPSTAALFGLGALAYVLRLRRRN